RALHMRGNDAVDCPDTESPGGAGKPQTRDHAAAEIKQPDALHHGHGNQTDNVEERAADKDADIAAAVGERARERLRNAPKEMLKRDGEAEGLAAPAACLDHRLEKDSEARAHAEGQERDQASRGDADIDDRS